MEAPKTLRRPANWQDFESLCKKLWGEIWNCPEIKKNGRSGQVQHGIDIYGIPSGEGGYNGIQCKGKEEYTNKQFTRDEINQEIEKAKLFRPPLMKLYLTTTALKDTLIEEFVRERNLESISTGLFEIHIYSWEDIVDLIDENKRTHDWYVDNQKFKSSRSVAVTFEDGLKELILHPKFSKKVTIHSQSIAARFSGRGSRGGMLGHYDITLPSLYARYKQNCSFSKVVLVIKNDGIDPIEEYKLLLEFIGGIQDIATSDFLQVGFEDQVFRKSKEIELFTNPLKGKIVPSNSVLVGDDFVEHEIFVKPTVEGSQAMIKWKLISKGLKAEGELRVVFIPEIVLSEKNIFVENPVETKTIEGEIEDFIIDVK